MSNAGRPTELDDELCLKIRAAVLEGKTMKELAQLCEIPFDTMEGWVTRNYNGFADKWRLYRTERRLKLAEDFGDELMMMPNDDQTVLKLKQKEAEFVRETVGRKDYAKRNELTGKDGDNIKIDITKATDEELIQLLQGK